MHLLYQFLYRFYQVMIEEGQERKCTPYTPASYGPSPVFGMEGMPRNASQYPPPPAGNAPPQYPYPHSGHSGAPPTAPPAQPGYPPNWAPGHPPMPNPPAPAYGQVRSNQNSVVD